jgi:metal-responsive CopG/Arc/MetJ family transcriptional regulator
MASQYRNATSPAALLRGPKKKACRMLSVRLDYELESRLNGACEIVGEQRSDFIRIAIAERIEQCERKRRKAIS